MPLCYMDVNDLGTHGLVCSLLILFIIITITTIEFTLVYKYKFNLLPTFLFNSDVLTKFVFDYVGLYKQHYYYFNYI